MCVLAWWRLGLNEIVHEQIRCTEDDKSSCTYKIHAGSGHTRCSLEFECVMAMSLPRASRASHVFKLIAWCCVLTCQADSLPAALPVRAVRAPSNINVTDLLGWTPQLGPEWGFKITMRKFNQTVQDRLVPSCV